MSSITCPNTSCGATLEGNDLRHCPRCGAFLPLPAQDAADPLVGQPILNGKYRILSIIGEGGMGKVYLAEQKIGGGTRKVAIKTLQPELASDPQIVARFLREAEIVVKLEHPNTIRFYDFGTLEEHGKQLFVVMEYLQGESLAHVLARGPLDVPRTERILSQVCGSLQEAHEQGIVHRDLKPENIFLVQRGARGDFVKVLDFGIAKRNETADDKEAKLTRQGMVLGTPPYMSPEQFTGQALDARSDIYALGVIAYEMLTGTLPFTAATPWEWATKHLTAPPTPIEQQPNGARVPEHTRRAIMRALSKNREQRQKTVVEFLAEFTGRNPEAALDWTASSTSFGSAGGTAAGVSSSNTPPTAVHPSGVSLPFAPSGAPMGQPGVPPATGSPVFGSSPSPGYVPAPSNAGFAAVPPSVHAGGGGSNPGFSPQPPGQAFGAMATGYPGVAPPAKKSSAVVVVGVIVALVVVAALGTGAVISIFGSDEHPLNPPQVRVNTTTQQNQTQGQVLTPNTQVAQVAANTQPQIPVQPLATPQPPVPTPPVASTLPNSPPTNSTPSDTSSPSHVSSRDDGRAAAIASQGLNALVAGNFPAAIVALQQAASVDRTSPGVIRLRNELRRRGRNRINDFILAGNCGAAQQLYRQLRNVGAAPGTDSFGDACPAP